ncbi:MAG: hypothetical protein UU71_C0001G0023 [Parcubacteria group bacterium GW2011_GWB1_41_6]|nr:MAG: hypothetical protein UU71_C0001G0023 [Parcubacteria group bacterium GW2011_GWB1_41_6]KKS34514.1 MAG: hypothetical protein UU96_C0003G0023 [Parcubacteria group bacterium GW2011_GWC2_42_13]KKS57735.1 MAG: hypothetical protein UV22_C0014G0006 [Parcubacteria group bacterium GW2011_GWA2_42_35]
MSPENREQAPEVTFKTLKADPAESCINFTSWACRQEPTLEAALRKEGCLYQAVCCNHPECKKTAKEAIIKTFLNPKKFLQET